jgi:hypothetical protein
MDAVAPAGFGELDSMAAAMRSSSRFMVSTISCAPGGNNQPRRWARIGAPRYVALALAAVVRDIPPWTPRANPRKSFL